MTDALGGFMGYMKQIENDSVIIYMINTQSAKT